jgi:hypothetical protein
MIFFQVYFSIKINRVCRIYLSNQSENFFTFSSLLEFENGRVIFTVNSHLESHEVQIFNKILEGHYGWILVN